MNSIKELSEILSNLKKEEIYNLFDELFTKAEIDTLSKRWRILKMLNENYTQRKIASELEVSLCKVTRGAKILKKSNSIVNKIIKGTSYGKK